MDRVSDAPRSQAAVPQDCHGLCYPTAGGSTSDRLRLVGAARRADAIVERWNAALVHRSDTAAKCAQAARDALLRVSPIARARLFDTPSAGNDAIDAGAIHEAADAGDGERQAARLVRHLVGHPDSPDATFVIGEPAIPPDGLYFPHLNIVVRPTTSGPLAIVQADSVVRLIWASGFNVTLSCEGEGLPADFRDEHLSPVPHVCGIPILNGAAEAERYAANFGSASPARLAAGLAVLRDGLRLLEAVWPGAFDAARRDVGGIVLLEPRDHARSHSPFEFPGVVLMTADDPARIGDLICHEASHIRMNRFREFDPIASARDPKAEAIGFESPWRPDPRPLRGIVDGVHAFLNVCRYHDRLRRVLPGEYGRSDIYERQKRHVAKGHALLREHAVPTTLGRVLFDEFDREVAAL